jgi:hypothetical protein
MRFYFATLMAALALGATSALAQQRNVDGIRDNSFLIEEAYNQEAGVVQHILNTVYSYDQLTGDDQHRLDLAFTQEWPVFSQAHQLSYTLIYSFEKTGGMSEDGLGDLFLNYRYQAFFDEESLTAFAPRFSLILPTGDSTRDFGSDTVGYQWNLPFSTTLGDFWFVHANAGFTFLPDASPAPRHDLFGYNLGASAIYAITPNLNLMLEWIALWKEPSHSAVDVSSEFSSVISPGVRRAFNFPGGSQLVLGLGLPIGLTRSAPDIGAFLYISFEHGFVKKHD